MSAAELAFWELWHTASGNILFDTETAAAMRDFLREQLAEPATIALTRAEARQALADPRVLGPQERAEYRKARAEFEADADLDADERYAPLLEALAARLGRRRAHEAVFTPERILGESSPLPLFNAQVELLLRALGASQDCDARSIERMVREDGVILKPPLLGRGEDLLRNAYFARHVLAILYRVFCVPEDREELRYAARVVRGGLSRDTGWLLTETTLIARDTKGRYRVLADTPEAIRAWMEQT